MYAVFAGFVVILLMPCWRGSLASWCTLCLQVCSGRLVYIVFTGLFWLVEDHWPLDVCHGLKSASGWWRTDLADWCIVCRGLLLENWFGWLMYSVYRSASGWWRTDLADVYCLWVCFLLVEEWWGQLMQIMCTDLLLGDGELIDVHCL